MIPRRRKWQPTPVFLPGELHGQRTLLGYTSWGCKGLGMTEQLRLSKMSYWLSTYNFKRRALTCFLYVGFSPGNSFCFWDLFFFFSSSSVRYSLALVLLSNPEITEIFSHHLIPHRSVVGQFMSSYLFYIHHWESFKLSIREIFALHHQQRAYLFCCLNLSIFFQ